MTHDEIVAYILMSVCGGAVCAIAPILLSGMFDDSPAFWLWPVFALIIFVGFCITRPYKGQL